MEFYMRILQKKRHQTIYTSITAKTSADLVKLSSCHFHFRKSVIGLYRIIYILYIIL